MTTQDAIDEMNGVFLAAWLAAGLSADNIRWSDKVAAVPADGTTWARVVPRHDVAPQHTIGEKPAFEEKGTLWMQIFTPAGDGNAAAYDVVDKIVAAYRGARGLGVWFRNTRKREIGTSGAFEQTNVLTDFTYDQR